MGLDATIAEHGFLDPNDPVAISFWIISISMVAATVFFLMESTTVNVHWKTSMNVGALVTLAAAVHYFYMREFWVQIRAVQFASESISESMQSAASCLRIDAERSKLPQSRCGTQHKTSQPMQDATFYVRIYAERNILRQESMQSAASCLKIDAERRIAS